MAVQLLLTRHNLNRLLAEAMIMTGHVTVIVTAVVTVAVVIMEVTVDQVGENASSVESQDTLPGNALVEEIEVVGGMVEKMTGMVVVVVVVEAVVTMDLTAMEIGIAVVAAGMVEVIDIIVTVVGHMIVEVEVLELISNDAAFDLQARRKLEACYCKWMKL